MIDFCCQHVLMAELTSETDHLLSDLHFHPYSIISYHRLKEVRSKIAYNSNYLK